MLERAKDAPDPISALHHRDHLSLVLVNRTGKPSYIGEFGSLTRSFCRVYKKGLSTTLNGAPDPPPKPVPSCALPDAETWEDGKSLGWMARAIGSRFRRRQESTLHRASRPTVNGWHLLNGPPRAGHLGEGSRTRYALASEFLSQESTPGRYGLPTANTSCSDPAHRKSPASTWSGPTGPVSHNGCRITRI